MRALRGALKLPEALCHLLAVRGHDTPEAAKSFLRPRLDTLHDPSRLRGAEAAAARLARAITHDEMVVVHGDYDVDGIAGSALLTSWIRALGGRAEAIVPDRDRHGYDLSEAGVERAAQRGARVLVTVDCGIMAHDPVRRAGAAGIEVIVTDHHRPGATLPDALAVVNPNRTDCGYPNKGLCGAGVVFKVGQLLAGLRGRPANESWRHLDLVAMATIADQVPLDGENRTMTRYGLRVLADTSRPGLRALKAQAGLAGGKAVDSAAVAYGLGPRINAAGRVGDPRKALRLLLADDADEANSLARELDGTNRRRRELDERVTGEAMEAMLSRCDPARERGIVVVGEGWHSGVIGIVASRLAERVFRPVIVVALEGDAGRGSARSIPPFDVHAAIARCSEHLDRFGGHHQAAGFDIRRDRLPAFREAFAAAARDALGTTEPVPELRADMVIALDRIDSDLNRYLRYLGPFGRGNREPVFVARGVRLADPRLVKGKHVKFRITRNGTGLDGIGFRLAHSLDPEMLGAEPASRGAASASWAGARIPPVDVAFNLMENTFRGYTTIQAKALDIRRAAPILGSTAASEVAHVANHCR